MIKINYESDFKLTEKTEEGFASIAFAFVYSTSSGTYTASYDGYKYVNCKRNSDGSVTVIFNHHGLGPGRLKVRREFFIPDADFADGVYNAVSNDTTDVMLVEGKTEGFDVEETFRPPYVVEGGGVSVEIVDSLDSDASDKALSANQGRILNERINVVTTDVEEIDASIKNISETLEHTNDIINNNTNNIASNAEEIVKTKANLDTLEGIVAKKADASKVSQIEIEVQKNTNTIRNNTARLVVLEGDGEGSIKKAVAEGIAEVVANAPEDLNTLKEVADYIASDKTKANEIEKAISDLGVKDAQLEDSIKANAEAILSKQPLLTGDEFKTINGQSIMGEGDIEIEGGEGGGIDSEPTNAVIESIEPNLVSTALRKTAQVLTENEKEQARKNIGAQKQLQLTVKDNGNIVLSNLDGETMEFMPATPSGDPMHWAYVSAGAEYNATTSFIVVNNVPWKSLVDPIAYKAQWNLDIVADNLVQSDSITYNGVSYRYAKDTRTSPTDGTQPRYRIVVKDDTTGKWVWDDTKVLYLPNRWYLNGLGDITNGEMREIYRIEKKDMSSGVYMLYWKQNTLRTATVRQGSYGVQNSGYSVSQNTTIEVVNFDTLAMFDNEVVGSVNIRHIISNTNKLTLEYMTKTISKETFSTKNLVTCNLRNLNKSISMDNSPNLSRATIKQLISKAIPTSAITITLHADAYARLAEDADIVAALEAKPLVTLVSA